MFFKPDKPSNDNGSPHESGMKDVRDLVDRTIEAGRIDSDPNVINIARQRLRARRAFNRRLRG